MTITNNINNKLEQVRLIDSNKEATDVVMTSILPEPYKGQTVLYFNNCLAKLIGANGETLLERKIDKEDEEFIRKSLEEASKDNSEKLKHNSEENEKHMRQQGGYRNEGYSN